MRLDKFLKVSRIIKRRTVANDACDAEHVTVNGKRAKASYEVKPNDIIEITFGQRTLKELTAQMLAIQNLRFYENGRLGAVLFTQQMLADAGLTEEEIGNVVDTPRGVEGVLIGISLRQLAADPTQYKVSSRANTEIDCAAVCANFGGGGHVRAAGCTITADDPEEALARMAEAFGAAIREAKGE